MFRYLLVLNDGEPYDPACYVSMIPNWAVGETFTLGEGESVRILAVDSGVLDGYRADGVFTVAPVDD